MSHLLVVYRRKNYVIYDSKDGFIVYNTNSSDFQSHHTHIKNFHTCKYLIDCLISHTIPKDLSNYLLTSMKRLCTEKDFRKRIDNALYGKENRKNGKKKN